MISVVNTQGKLRFSFVGTIDSAAFIDYLKTLLHDIPGKIFLILDGYPAHRSAEMKAFVKSTKGRLSIFFLPPYSPELNPDEWIWKTIKHDRVGRAVVRSVEELTDKIERAVDRLQAAPNCSQLLPGSGPALHHAATNRATVQ